MKERGPLGDMVLEFRTKAGLSQEDVSDQSGVSRSVIGWIESGRTKKPGVDKLLAIAPVIGIFGDDYRRLLQGAGWDDQHALVPTGRYQSVNRAEFTELAARVERLEQLLEDALRRQRRSGAR